MADFDIATLRLGKLPPRHDTRTLRLASYLDVEALPPPPSSANVASGIMKWPMYANDILGDCTCAAAGHQIEVWTKMNGRESSITTATVKKIYLKLSPQDQGCVELDVLNYWRKSGFGSHKLHAFASVFASDVVRVKLAVVLLGGCYIGIALPTSAQQETGPSKVWTSTADAPGSWGGHAVNVIGYDTQYVYVVTWGMIQRMTWNFWLRYVEEAWALLTEDWNKHVPVPGFDFAALNADLAQLGRVA